MSCQILITARGQNLRISEEIQWVHKRKSIKTSHFIVILFNIKINKMKLFDESEEAQIWTSASGNQRDTQVKNLNQNHRKENLKNFLLATIGPTKLFFGITLVLLTISIILMFILINEEKESWNLGFN